jgi:hypothetical protein
LIESGKRARFLVTIKNGTSRSVPFSTEDITVTTNDAVTGEELALKVYSYEDLAKEEKGRHASAGAAVALERASDPMNALHAVHTNNRGTHARCGYTRYGTNSYADRNCSNTTYKYAALQTGQSVTSVRSQAWSVELESEDKATMDQLASTILRKETVLPGEWYGGFVEVQMPGVTTIPRVIRVVIQLAGEPHSFIFEYKADNYE